MIRVYCHGKMRTALLLNNGWAVCICGERIRVVA